MKSPLCDKKATLVLLVEPATSLRLVLAEVLRSLGFEKFHSVANPKEALSYLEVERVDWIITPMMISDEVNALHLLKLQSLHAELRRVQISFLVDLETEGYCLPHALEMGLVSWHARSYSKDALRNDFEELLCVLEVNDWDATLAAAEYVRLFLAEKAMVKSRLALEQSLLALYPGRSRVLMTLAEAEYLNNNAAKAEGLLDQATLIDEAIAPLCAQIRDRFAAKSTGTPSIKPENVLGLRTVVVIDPDTDVLHGLKAMFTAIGVKAVECFEDGKKALEWLAASPEVSLILMEWKVPSLSGPVLVQRIRNQISNQVPIIVVSSLIKKDERPLLREMGVDNILEKPFDPGALYRCAIWSVQENRKPNEQKSLERKIRRLLGSRQDGEAERLIAQFLSDPRIEPGAKREMEAEYEFSRNNFQRALVLSGDALKLGGGDSLAILNIAGKCLLKLKRFPEALRCFEKANEISPMNIGRLLDLAEVNLHLQRVDDAQRIVASVAALDAGNPALKEAKGQIALERGDVDSARAELQDLEALPKVAAYINNRAVALILSGRFEEGIERYKRALSALPPASRDARNSIAYNLALGLARYGEYEKSLASLQEFAADPTTEIGKKASSLSRRLQRSLQKGVPLFPVGDALQDREPEKGKDENPEAPPPVEWNEILQKIEAKRGDIGCYQIFYCVEAIDPKASALIADTPRFKSRLSFEREETFTKLEAKK